MAIKERTLSLPVQWAETARTGIPAEPVSGVAYRKDFLTVSDIAEGQAYKSPYDTALHNQLNYLVSGLLMMAERYGIMPYSTQTNYPEQGLCLGDDGILYQAVQASGPDNGGAKSVNNTSYWQVAVVVPDRAIHTAAPLTGGGTLREDRTLGINASSAAIGDFVIQRDASGRAQVVAPVAADDIARKAETDAAATTAVWANVSGKPSTFTPAAHTHDAGNIASGTLPIVRGGTGGATSAAARTALGITPANIGAVNKAGDTMTGRLNSTKDIVSTAFDSFRHIQGQRGVFFRNNGVQFFILSTRADDQYGSFNSDIPYPLIINLETGICNISGNAATADKFKIARTIALSGGATGTATSFNGSANITIPVTALDVSKATAGTLPIARGGTGGATAAAARTALGITPANIGAVNKAGDTMTGLLHFNISKRTNTPLDIRPAADNYGDALLVTCGGLTVVGGGEFPQSFFNTGTLSPGNESLILGSDSWINLVSGYQDPLNAKWIYFDNLGNFYPKDNNTLNIGTTTYRFAGGNFVNLNVSGTITGNITGNAGTSTRLQTARTIALSGGAIGTATSFNGSANITIPVTALDVSKATAGTLPVARGGTGTTSIQGLVQALYAPGGNRANPEHFLTFGGGGASSGYTTPQQARNAMGLGNTLGVLPVANGGTGANAAATARANLGVTPANIGAVNKAGDTMTGNLTMGAEIRATGLNSFRHVQGNYGAFWRNDGSNFWLALTNLGDQYGTYNSLRPFVVNLASGAANISGNAVTATRLQTARTIAISGGATGTATSFNGTANITIPVTALDVSKATAGTLPAARGGTGRTDGKAVALATPRTISLTGAITGSTTFDGSGNVSINTTAAVLPKGIITMWSGAATAIPSGWALCNGANGTPDLRNRFIIGAGRSYAVNATGGATTHSHTVNVGATTLSTSQMPAHSHKQGSESLYNYSGGGTRVGYRDYPVGSGASYHSQNTANTGGGSSHTHSGSSGSGSTMPPYYALCYIMKL